MQNGDDGDAGESGGEAGGEGVEAEEAEGNGGEPHLKGWLFEPEGAIPVGDKPGAEGVAGEHFAGDFGVYALVPIGEGAMAEEGKENEGSEKSRE